MRLHCCTCRKRTVYQYFMYGTPALHLNDKQTSELNACWNSVIRKLFGYHKWESVSAVLLGLGRLNFKHLVMLRKVKFYWNLYCSTDMFLNFSLCCFKYDSVLKSVFTPDLTLLVMSAFLLIIM